MFLHWTRVGVYMQVKTLFQYALLAIFIFANSYASSAQAGDQSNLSKQDQTNHVLPNSVGSDTLMQPTIQSSSDSAWIIPIVDRYLFPVLLIIFGALVVLLQYKYLVSAKPNPDLSLPTFSLTLIITGTLALVSLNSNTQVLGTVVGLFGTIAGYVLGRSVSKKASQQPDGD